VKRPSRAAVLALRDRLAPDGRVVAVRALRGGISNHVYAVRLEDGQGLRQDLVVRTFGADWANDPAVCTRELQLLEVLAAHGFAAPRPVLADQDGAIFGTPTLVLSHLPGRGLLSPRRVDSYVGQLADTLAELHQLPVDDLDFLPRRPPRLDRGASSEDALEAEVWSALRALWPDVERAQPEPVLVHGDYWPGNTIWRRERLSGVVDWEMAQVGNPARDLATCRCDLSILFDVAVADAFTSRYERHLGHPVVDLGFWDLYVVSIALRYIGEWVAGYQALGRADLDGPTAKARLAEYARSRLAVAGP